MNPSKQILSESKINIYGSSLESLLVLFNYNNEIDLVQLNEFKHNTTKLVLTSSISPIRVGLSISKIAIKM